MHGNGHVLYHFLHSFCLNVLQAYSSISGKQVTIKLLTPELLLLLIHG